jgi:hypothetical protein
MPVSSRQLKVRAGWLISGPGMVLELGVSSRTQLAAEVSRPPGRG